MLWSSKLRILDLMETLAQKKKKKALLEKRFRTHTTGLELCISHYEFKIIFNAISP